jgi:HAD superfamily hydrolase (TIGR01549 family)
LGNNGIKAIIWDYDGTLVDTRQKNLNVTRNIVESLLNSKSSVFPALQTLENYTSATRKISNWREFYRQKLNLSEEQIDEAGRMWTPYQLTDNTDAAIFEGIDTVIAELAEFPQGIVSQNSKSSISRNLKKLQMLPFFKHIVGYEEVELKKQKPEPDGLLSCLKKLAVSGCGSVCYIGDHQTDVLCVQAANRVLQSNGARMNIFSIGACYESGTDTSAWRIRPDYEARRTTDILDIVDRLSINST